MDDVNVCPGIPVDPTKHILWDDHFIKDSDSSYQWASRLVDLDFPGFGNLPGRPVDAPLEVLRRFAIKLSFGTSRVCRK